MSLGTGPTREGRCDGDTIPPQPTVMVTGRVGRQLRSVAIELFEARSTARGGAVVVTTRESPTAVVRRLTGGPCGFDSSHLAVIDARGVDDELEVGWLRRVEPRSDPGVMDEAVSTALAWLDEAGVERRHFLYDTLATDYRMPDDEAAYDRAYQLAMTLGAEEGLALFTLDVEGLSDDVVEKLGHLFDVHVELRERHGNTELRWTGLLGASEGWVGLGDANLGVGAFR